MNWDALGAIAELVGAAGVIATLGYLAVQVRQNTISTRTSSYQAVVEAISDWSRAMGLTPGAAALFVKGNLHLESLSSEERAQYNFIQTSLYRNFENIFYQHEQGAIDEIVWDGWSYRIRSNFAAPGIQTWWAANRPSYSAPFRRFLEENPIERDA
jgi:hypothetical protein